MEQERRVIPPDGVEMRQDADGTPTGIAGMGAVFNSRTVIAGMFEEEIAETFFDDVLDDPEIMGLFNHNPDFPLARTGSGTMNLAKESRGVNYEIPVLPRSRSDVLEAVERRDVSGNSFAFMMPEDGSGEQWFRPRHWRGRSDWPEREDDGELPLRVLTKAEKVFDFGPVTYPAYSATTVSARSRRVVAEITPEELREACSAVECPSCQAKDAEIARLVEQVQRSDALIQRLT